MTPSIITDAITLKVFSYSMHSGLIPVGVLGRKGPKGFAEGDRTIAGTMIATLTINDPLMDMQPLLYSGVYKKDDTKAVSDVWRTFLLPDQYPLFDVVFLFMNELGYTSAMSIFGIKITDVGQVMSMSDSEIEVTYTYTALDMEQVRLIDTGSNHNGAVLDISRNADYIAKRNKIYNGVTDYRDSYEIGAVYSQINNRYEEIKRNRKLFQ
jgi:hypothetical protein